MTQEQKKRETNKESAELVETLLNVRRVAKVIKGGRRFGFSALVVVGDRQGNVGIALGKGREVSVAVQKAFKRARKNMITVPLYKTTIPFTIQGKHGASKVILRSASEGTGVIAGGAMRTILEAVGVKDILAKSLGAANAQNVAKATLDAFSQLRSAGHLARLRGKSIKEMIGASNVTTK